MKSSGGAWTGLRQLAIVVIVCLMGGTAYWLFSIQGTPSRYRGVEGQVMARALAEALTRFYHEYNRLPDGPQTLTTDSKAGAELLMVLSAQGPAAAGPQNPRKIVFLEVKEAKGLRGGLVYAPAPSDEILGMYDPYGQPYHVVLNTNYDPVFEFDYAGTMIRLPAEKAAVFSAGKDGKLGTMDDMKSW